MSEIELPEEVVSPYNDMIADIAQHLRQTEQMEPDEVIVSAEINFRVNKPVVLEEYKTRKVESSDLR